MDLTTWWKAVEPAFQFGVAAGFAIILLSAMLWFGRRLVLSHETASVALVKIGVVLDEHARDHNAIRSDIRDLKETLPCAAPKPCGLEVPR